MNTCGGTLTEAPLTDAVSESAGDTQLCSVDINVTFTLHSLSWPLQIPPLSCLLASISATFCFSFFYLPSHNFIHLSCCSICSSFLFLPCNFLPTVFFFSLCFHLCSFLFSLKVRTIPSPRSQIWWNSKHLLHTNKNYCLCVWVFS